MVEKHEAHLRRAGQHAGVPGCVRHSLLMDCFRELEILGKHKFSQIQRAHKIRFQTKTKSGFLEVRMTYTNWLLNRLGSEGSKLGFLDSV